MGIAVHCTACGARYEVAKEYAGRKAKCGKCGAVMAVPRPEDSAASDDPGGHAIQTPDQAPVGGASAEDSHCPECAAPIAPNAVLCVQCGFDLRSGRKTATETAAGKRVRRRGWRLDKKVKFNVITWVGYGGAALFALVPLLAGVLRGGGPGAFARGLRDAMVFGFVASLVGFAVFAGLAALVLYVLERTTGRRR